MTAVLVMIACCLLIAPPASGQRGPAEKLATRFSEFTLTPPNIDLEHNEVTFAGRLLYADAQGAEHGLSGVTVRLGGDSRPKATVATDAEGRFSGTTRLTGGGHHYVWFSGRDNPYKPAASEYVDVRATRAPSRLTINVSPKPKVAGQKVTVSGRLEAQTSSGTWIGVGNTGIWVTPDPRVSGFPPAFPLETTTADDGSYQVSVVVPFSAYWGARPAPSAGLIEDTPVSTEFLPVAHPTRIAGFNASPEPVRKGKKIKISGTLQKWTDRFWYGEPYAPVKIYFRRKGSAAWVRMGTDDADKAGRFSRSFTAKRDGSWRVVFGGRPGLLSSKSRSDYVNVR